MNRTPSWITVRALLLLVAVLLARPVAATDWTVSVTLHEAESTSDDDASGEDDLYLEASFSTTVGIGGSGLVSTKPQHVDNRNHIFPDWTLTSPQVSGGVDTTVEIALQLKDHDWGANPDDVFDIHNDPRFRDLVLVFQPATHLLSIKDLGGWQTPRCALGGITTEGFHGDDRGRILFSVSASLIGSAEGDSDGDGLLDSWEICGVDGNGDGTVDVDLPAMGADPYRKDLFVEIDWMMENAGPDPHSHEPWLPALLNAWHEFDAAPVTSPGGSGIALHVDVGQLFADYELDFHRDQNPEIRVDPTGSLDLSGDGIPDIGDLGALGAGSPGGGEAIQEIGNLAPSPAGKIFEPGSEFATLKAMHFASTRESVFHYALFAHSITHPLEPGASGAGERCPRSPQWTPAGAEASVPQNLGADGRLWTCDDLVVALGGWPPQYVRRASDGSEMPPRFLRGPSGLRIDGSISRHTAILLHELGHGFGLDHGGLGQIDLQPNYLTVMNSFFQGGIYFDFDGDSFADAVGVDFDHDGTADRNRIRYSSESLAPLEESQLLEDQPLGTGGALTTWRCPPQTGRSGGPATVQGPFDWDCDGWITPSPTTVRADINGDGIIAPAGVGGLPTGLVGRDDYRQIADTFGLPIGKVVGAQASPSPGISLALWRKLRSESPRVRQLPNEASLRDRCTTTRRIGFDELPAPTVVGQQFAPTAIFSSDSSRQPTVVGPAELGGVSTSSPPNALLGRVSAPDVPLVVSFRLPQRLVAMQVGWLGSGMDGFAVVEAFDTEGLPMGQARVALPGSPNAGSGFLGLGAIYPDQLIGHIELGVEPTLPSPPRLLIDDLLLCEATRSVPAPPAPATPVFGDRSVRLNLIAAAEVLVDGPDEEHEFHSLGRQPLTVPLTVDGLQGNTRWTRVVREGTAVEISAPVTVQSGGVTLGFVGWEMNRSVFFPRGQRELSLQMLRDASLVALYAPEELFSE
jgi:hypothetical protein